MPHRPYWYKDVPFVLRWAEAINEPLLDRKAIETMFRVRANEAQRIMRNIGACELGGAYVVYTHKLVRWLQRLKHNGCIMDDESRVRRVAGAVEEARKLLPARQVRIQADATVRELENMPKGIHLRPGKLEIEFFGTEDLLRHLFELSQIITSDFLRFQSLIEE